MEDHMKLRGEAKLEEEAQEHAPLFSPRMSHSGAELDTFPDTFLEACAHAGMDAIIVYAGHPDTTLHGFPDPDPLWPGSGIGYCDFNNLVWRAEGYGLDVYVYSHMRCDVHPRDPKAREYYEASFGTLFRKAPGLKGIIFVGETFEFPSLDPHTSGIRVQLKDPADPRPGPGWYPCFDYPELVTMVRDTIFRYNPEADILFWTYNWGWAPKEERLALIKNLPKDITLHVTFDMFEKFTDENGTPYTVDDYSISFEGPAQVFIDEAKEALRQGIRLYSQTNTGGRAWDSGITPYLPVPHQWQRRYEKLREAHDKYNLRGLMENHHYGWMPSFLTLFEKNAFTTNTISDYEMLRRIAIRDFGPAAVAGFLHSTYVTCANVMRWNIAKCLLKALAKGCEHACDAALLEAIGAPQTGDTSFQINILADLMRQTAAEETANTLQALCYHEADSRIGFEATMEYVFDHEHAAWKNEETQRSLAQLETFLQKYNI